MSASAARVDVVRAGAEHAGALSGFYREVWDPTSTPESVAASRAAQARANLVTPGEPFPTWIVLQDGRAIAHVTTIPVLLWRNGREHPAHWLKGLWVLPEFQRSSAGFLVLRAAVDALPSALSLLHETAAIRLLEALGFRNLGALPNAMRVLDARSLMARVDLDAVGLAGIPPWMRATARAMQSLGAPVLGPVAGAATSVWATAATGPGGGHAVTVSDTLDHAEADALWARVRDRVAPAPARGAAQLGPRYAQGGEYAFVRAHARGALQGLAVVKRPRASGDPRLGGARIATVSDLVFAPDDARAGLSVLRGAERAARALGADAVLCSASAASVAPLLRRRGYVQLPPNLYVLARFAGEDDPPPGIGAWWFTRGDSEGDGSF